MTGEEMLAYAKSVAEGGQVKKADVVAFMKALVAQTEDAEEEVVTTTEVDPDIQAGGPSMAIPEVADLLPKLPFEIDTTMNGGIHMPRESNRSYTRPEAMALIYKIAAAIKYAL